jgi:hypothetical protein
MAEIAPYTPSYDQAEQMAETYGTPANRRSTTVGTTKTSPSATAARAAAALRSAGIAPNRFGLRLWHTDTEVRLSADTDAAGIAAAVSVIGRAGALHVEQVSVTEAIIRPASR